MKTTTRYMGAAAIIMLAALIGIASVFWILAHQKSEKEKGLRKKLDEFYLKKLRTDYSTILFEAREAEPIEYNIIWARESLNKTKERMSVDGYNWQQVEEMAEKAKWKEKAKIWSQEEGYRDGFAGKPINPEKCLFGTAPTDIQGCYLGGYQEGEKDRLNK